MKPSIGTPRFKAVHVKRATSHQKSDVHCAMALQLSCLSNRHLFMCSSSDVVQGAPNNLLTCQHINMLGIFIPAD